MKEITHQDVYEAFRVIDNYCMNNTLNSKWCKMQKNKTICDCPPFVAKLCSHMNSIRLLRERVYPNFFVSKKNYYERRKNDS